MYLRGLNDDYLKLRIRHFQCIVKESLKPWHTDSACMDRCLILMTGCVHNHIFIIEKSHCLLCRPLACLLDQRCRCRWIVRGVGLQRGSTASPVVLERGIRVGKGNGYNGARAANVMQRNQSRPLSISFHIASVLEPLPLNWWHATFLSFSFIELWPKLNSSPTKMH